MKVTSKQLAAMQDKVAGAAQKPAVTSSAPQTIEDKPEKEEPLNEPVDCISINSKAEQAIYCSHCIGCKEKKTGKYLLVTAKQISKEEFLELVPKENRL